MTESQRLYYEAMSRIEKRAGLLGMAGGLVSKLATSPLKAGMATLKGVGRLGANAAQNNPMGVALGTAMTIPMVPSMLRKDPVEAAKAAREAFKTKQLAAAAGGGMNKMSSIGFSASELRRGMAIRRGLEKSAGYKSVGGRKGFGILSYLLGKSDPVKKKTIDAAGNLVEKDVEKDFADAVMDEMSSPSGLFSVTGPAKFLAAGLAAGVGVGAAGALTAGTAYGVGKASEKIRELGRDGRYRKMVKADPALAGSEQARGYFNVLDRASPYIAGEPQVAAATVRTMMEAPEGYALHPKYMKDILGVEESRQKTRFPILRAPTFKGELPEV